VCRAQVRAHTESSLMSSCSKGSRDPPSDMESDGGESSYSFLDDPLWDWEGCLPSEGPKKYVAALQCLGLELAKAVPKNVQEKAITPLNVPPTRDLLVGVYGKSTTKERLLIKNYCAIHCLVTFRAFQARKPSKEELKIVLNAFNHYHQGLAIRPFEPEDDFEETRDRVIFKLGKLWSGLRRKWQNSRHASRSPWVQTLKDLMRNPVTKDAESVTDADLDAETEPLGGSESSPDSESSDPIPDNFMGVVDVPDFEGSSSSQSEDDVSDCGSDVWKGVPTLSSDEEDPLPLTNGEESQPEPHSIVCDGEEAHAVVPVLLGDDPANFDETDCARSVSPVNVGNRKKRGRGNANDEVAPGAKKPKKKLRRKAKKSKAKKGSPKNEQGEEAVEPSKDSVLESFAVTYQALIKTLPVCMWPTSTKHGEHSYTVWMGSARVEVLLRQMAFKPKADINGVTLTGESARSITFVKDVGAAWKTVCEVLRLPSQDGSD